MKSGGNKMAKAKSKADNVKIIVNYIETLVKTPSPTGYTRKVVDYLVKNAKEKGIEHEVTRKGAVIYKFGTGIAKTKTMLSVHVDTLGAIVKRVEKKRIWFDCIGGYPPEYVVGNYCTIHAFDGSEIPGTILPVNPSTHVNKDLKDSKFKWEDLAIRADLKLRNEKDGFDKHMRVGDFVSFDPNYSFINGFVKSRHLDDKASASILLTIADILSEKNSPKLKSDFLFFFNVTEETGQGIAGYPDIDNLLVVDMGAVGEGLTGDEFSVSICAKDSTGPYNFDFRRELTNICVKNRIPHKIDIFPFYGSDGSGALNAGRDIRVALIGPGVGASHGYERTHVDSLMGVYNLVIRYILG